MNLKLEVLSQYKPEDLKTEDGYDKHLHCEGSREHVLSYSSKGVHCSHKNCVVNRDHQSNVRDWVFIQPCSKKPKHPFFKLKN